MDLQIRGPNRGLVLKLPISESEVKRRMGKPLFDGPISGPMWKKVSSLNSNYPDLFNWAVYDQLYARFKGDPPRGGVVFKTILKLVNAHTECSKCHYSFELDTYGRGCIHDCLYCYAKDQLTLRGYWNRPIPMPVDLAEVRTIFHSVFETSKKHKWRKILEQRIPLRIGSMSDPFMWMDQKYGISKELLRILKYYKYPFVVFTRSDLIATQEYLSLIDPNLTSVQFSISGENEELTKLIEPGAPSVSRRLNAIRKLSDAGIWTAVRINPLFPAYPDGFFTDREDMRKRFPSKEIPKFSLLDIEEPSKMLSQLSDSGCKTVLAGFVRLNQTSISRMSRSTGIDFRRFFKKENYKTSGESHYSDSEITYYYKVLQDCASKLGMRFSTCYIGNGLKDYFQYQNLWSNRSDCCDIVGNVEAFNRTCQTIGWDERRRHSRGPATASEHDEPNRKNTLVNPLPGLRRETKTLNKIRRKK